MMRHRKHSLRYHLLAVLLPILLLLGACTAAPAPSSDNTSSTEPSSLRVVATTTMLADLAHVIGGEHADVQGLMGPGIDPHLYQASAGDVSLLQNADVIVYNGLHLEGRMGEIFDSLTTQGARIICIGDGLDSESLLTTEDETVYDPHIWYDVSLWKEAARIVSAGLTEADPAHADTFSANLDTYLKELDTLDAYIRTRAAELPESQRVLVTAHDAFGYFGAAYGFEVMGLQGISTAAEAGTADMRALADTIAAREIRAIFIESSVPARTVEALQAAVKSRGFDVAIGGELYSDSLGTAEHGTDTYIGTFHANIDTIVGALKQQ